jgi:hypothetical protein
VYGHRWPPAEVLIPKGFAYLVPGVVVAPAAHKIEPDLHDDRRLHRDRGRDPYSKCGGRTEL